MRSPLNSSPRGTHDRNRRSPDVGRSTLFNALTKNNVPRRTTRSDDQAERRRRPTARLSPRRARRSSGREDPAGDRELRRHRRHRPRRLGGRGSATSPSPTSVETTHLPGACVPSGQRRRARQRQGRPTSDIETLHTELIPPTCRPSRRPCPASRRRQGQRGQEGRRRPRARRAEGPRGGPHAVCRRAGRRDRLAGPSRWDS